MKKIVVKASQRRNHANPQKTCFGCGKTILNRPANALYCKKCSRIKSDLYSEITSMIWQKRLKQKYHPYTFTISLNIIKKRGGMEL